MSSINDRERAFEAKFAADEHAEFRAVARRDKALALWAGEQLGLSGAALEDYVLAVWRTDLQHPGDSDVEHKVRNDLAKAGINVSEETLHAKLLEFMTEARREMHARA